MWMRWTVINKMNEAHFSRRNKLVGLWWIEWDGSE